MPSKRIVILDKYYKPFCTKLTQKGNSLKRVVRHVVNVLTCFDICCFICVGRQNGPKMTGFGKNEFSDIKLWFSDTQKAYSFAESCYFLYFE